MAHGLSEGEPLRFHITMHRGTAPNDIHIFIRLISSDSSTFSRHGTFIPILDKVSANDRRLDTQISSNANLAFSSLLCNFSTGKSRELQEILARQLQQPEWRTHLEMSPRLLQPQHSPLFWLTKFSSCSNWSTWLSDYQVIKLCIYILYLLPLYYLILMNLSASKNISMTFQCYVEEWNSNFPHFKSSIPFLV